MFDPLVEICHLCNPEDDILFMSFHPLQSEIPKVDLLYALQLECINRVNEVPFIYITNIISFLK